VIIQSLLKKLMFAKRKEAFQFKVSYLGQNRHPCGGFNVISQSEGDRIDGRFFQVGDLNYAIVEDINCQCRNDVTSIQSRS
jgi:hypothetical protein